ncbi:MAG: ABC transporter substrate-binding protein [Prevotellaceae bacterium]|jgi:iron complex transport system substrate-binding protein|nr:ABC transporter substrate-binding protein [Prevotellaceae bacterium]
MKSLFFILCSLLFICCSPPQKKEARTAGSGVVELKYAEGFSVDYFDGYKRVVVYSPWEQGAEYACYYLVEDSGAETPADGVKVQIPLPSLASASVTHFEFLAMLGELETLTGVCLPALAFNEDIVRKNAVGELLDLGDPFKINVEKTLSLRPSALMISGYNQNDANVQRVVQAGIPVLFNNEWMEKSLLGRAEWIKFVAAFYNKEALADSVFSEVERNYNTIKEKAAKAANKPQIMAGSNFRGTWYMPAGNSFMGRLFADAGAAYFYANDTTAGSLPLNVETVLKNFASADVWLNCNFASLDELLKADSKHGLFNAVKRKEVYNFNKRMLPSGANDFWESAVARPDLLLADVIAILHPGILPEHELIYAEKLK